MQTRLVLFDVDGVLTDGTLWIGPQGEAFKGFNAKDGVAVALLKKYGLQVGIVSGKASAALDVRVEQLQFDVAITGCSDKLGAIQAWLADKDYGLESVVFVGDDVSCFCYELKRGNSSITIHVDVWAARHHSDNVVKVTEGVFTFVAVGSDGRPRPLLA
ncbi:MAG: 3-deoxy-D-manno-octulosonate 8-phosphate phosphatase [Gammaproteobacteria bacterium]|nr:3-deoxy-D-manno-octulosonate 8-phosphate phosphatase [Gammaproteobacteria bacterium]